jgi:monoamine oxidase
MDVIINPDFSLRVHFPGAPAMPIESSSTWNPRHFPDDPFDYLTLVKKGLPRARRPRKVLVVGAGAAGLCAGYELLRAGHEPFILEASHRIGGRLYTLRESFSPGLYGEAGSMRIPEVHRTTLHYTRELFGLKTRPFPNVGEKDNGFYHLQGKLYPGRKMKGVSDFAPNRVLNLWETSFAPIRERLEEAASADRLREVWKDLVEEYQEYSLGDFLVRGPRPWSAQDVALFGQVGLGLGGYTSMLGIAFVEMMRLFYCGWDREQVEIVGGCDQLARKFLTTPPPQRESTLEERIRFGAKVVRIEQDGEEVRAFWGGPAGSGEARGDFLILTVPFPVLGTSVEIDPPFSEGKRRAIQSLHYISSTKVFLQTRKRFWEPLSPGEPPSAGTTITDMPLRAAYFPPEPFPGTPRSLILASYTWEEDAERWYAMEPRERLRVAAQELGTIFPNFLDHCESGASIAWHQEPFARGAFALFTPQQINLYEDIVRPEGRIRIAGEHASFVHGWVEGAVQSGLRAALRIAEEALENDA